MRLEFDPAALNELLDAVQHYEGEQEGLGTKFHAALWESLELIREYPEAAPVTLFSVRRRILTGFPYQVFYRLDESGIFILAISHDARNPGYWLTRLEDSDR